MSIPVVVYGPDASGGDFLERTSTVQISRDGASVVLKHQLAPRQKLMISCVNTRKKGQARVVAAFGGQGQGHVYGVALENNDPRFWGVAFPPVEETEGAGARILLECTKCRARAMVQLTEMELKVFEDNRLLTRHCTTCANSTPWLRRKAPAAK